MSRIKIVTRADLRKVVYRRGGLTRAGAAELVELVLKEISETLVQGEQVKLPCFGSFIVRNKGRRMGRNPKTGQPVPIESRRVLVFKPSKIMKDKLNVEHLKNR